MRRGNALRSQVGQTLDPETAPVAEIDDQESEDSDYPKSDDQIGSILDPEGAAARHCFGPTGPPFLW